MKTKLLCLIFIALISCSKDNDQINPEENYYQDGEVEVIFENDPNGINIVFLGEGYIKDNLNKDRDAYRDDAYKHINYLFSVPPFSEYQENFNAYIVYAESDERGPSEENKTPKNTKFGVTYGKKTIGDIERTTVTELNSDMINQYAQLAVPDIDIYTGDGKNIILLSVVGGTGGVGGGGLAVFEYSNKRIMLHEVGHAFANLGDEYVYPGMEGTPFTENRPNLDITKDLNNIKWSHFIGLEGYEHVGAFEGGGLYTENVWRPEFNSIMRATNPSSANFNTPSREAIVKRIMEVKGESFDFEEFIEKDKVALLMNGRQKHEFPEKGDNNLIDCSIFILEKLN